jgi:putative transposase
MWSFCGTNEIQEPRRKNVLIVYEKLQKYVGAVSYEQLKRTHRGWVEEYLSDQEKIRQEEWTSSIAVGSRSFVEHVKALLGYRAKGRDVIGGNEKYQLREGPAHYKGFFGAENGDIGLENVYFWNVNAE